MLRRHGYGLRSGGAQGADTAFELAYEDAHPSECEIFLPWRGFNGRDNGITLSPSQMQACMERVREVHAAWHALTPAARKLHARNACQVFGLNLDVPSTVVLCWTPDGCESHSERSRATGGTGTAISLASLAQIPVINAARSDWYQRLVQVAPQLSWAHPPALRPGE